MGSEPLVFGGKNLIRRIEQLQTNGPTSLHRIAKALNAQGVQTTRGSDWNARQASRVLARTV
jgi:hypothetical protein